jgi:hypothetical protein
MAPADKPKDKPDEAPAEPAGPPKKYYLLVGKTSIKGPFTAEQLKENPDFTEASKLAPLGATKASHWKPAERFEELRLILEQRKLAAEAEAAKAKPAAPKPAP